MAITYLPPVVMNGLVLYLDAANPKSYPGSGTAWNDLSGRGNNGTLTNGPTFSGDNAGSIVFDGVNDYVSVANTPDINASEQAKRTIEVWFKTTADISTRQVVYEEGGASNNYAVYIDGGYAYIGGRSFTHDWDTATFLSGSISTNSWNCVQLVLNAAESDALQTDVYYGYLNGVSIGVTDGSRMSSHTGTITIGNNGGTQNTLTFHDAPTTANTNPYHFSGNVSSLKIYNYALSATEVLQNYNATKNRFGL